MDSSQHRMKGTMKSLMAICLLVFGTLQSQDGAKLFKQNCAVCHAAHTDQRLTGPGLKGVFDRVPKPAEEWLTKWILNNEKMIKAGDPYAVKIYNEYGKAAMTVFEGILTEADVKAILDYIKNPPSDNVQTAGSSGVSGSAGISEEDEEAAKKDNTVLYVVLLAIVILSVLWVALRNVRVALENLNRKIEGKEILEDKGLYKEVEEWFSKNRRLVGAIGVILVFVGMKSCWNACYNIGVYYDWRTQKGYKPEQPIKFSHKLHAGDHEIACQYCHNSVEKSRHAGIPSVNVCMNCHKAIQKGPKYGEKEIAKIYEAAGFDPKTNTYDPSKQKPIEWIKVHNLPDHVYFNHSQHVVVGKIECQTCHGDVKNMTVAEQKSPLTMKWCIECHRQTEVAGLKDNPYYERMHQYLKEKYKGKKDVKFTVEKIGGLECGKCHY
ncbi:MAG: c-type cytochrome [Bacteroidia bacterium]|nr:c-type cytochrome [Bacteroidia bacterium]